MQIKTLAEILAESEADSASTSIAKQKIPKRQTSNRKQPFNTTIKDHQQSTPSEKVRSVPSDDDKASQAFEDNSSNFSVNQQLKLSKTKSKKRQKRFHPASNFTVEPNDIPSYQPPEPQSIKQMLTEVKCKIHNEDNNENSTVTSLKIGANSETDNLPSALKTYLRTPEQRQAEVDAIKADSRLRWLAFYYLSRREYGKAELKQKLLDKEQDPDKVEALLDEFEGKGYQSDYRTTLMLIRESIRKGRGRDRIKQEFYRKKIAIPSNVDELIDMANAESDEFNEFVDDSSDSLVEGVDWLKLAVAARIKKYGDDIPTEQKDKARQLRFLQYRGFKSDICFQALNYTLSTLDDRF